ncbi:basic secretory protein-like protein [Lysobacter sp. CA199]|uniref:basic secretory protein-like protein n=1 Tax=Lysobacter sp. CA199 TaxID=3455608 RepID=UPI003F8D8771
MRRCQPFSAVLAATATATALCSAIAPAHAAESRVYTRSGYTVDFRDLDGKTQQVTADRMVERFFEVYPRLAADFNPSAVKTLQFRLDPAYDAVAYADDGKVVYNPGWFVKHPDDIDVVTHEVMHIVQAYGPSGQPGWLVEGIADYVRHVYGGDNQAAGWALPAYATTQKVTDGYRVTARFLAWLELHGHAGIVKSLDARLRAGQYTAAAWRALTGNSVDQLWASYAADPRL